MVFSDVSAMAALNRYVHGVQIAEYTAIIKLIFDILFLFFIDQSAIDHWFIQTFDR